MGARLGKEFVRLTPASRFGSRHPIGLQRAGACLPGYLASFVVGEVVGHNGIRWVYASTRPGGAWVMLRLIFYALFRPNGLNPAKPTCLNPESKPKESSLSQRESTYVIVGCLGFLLIVVATASNRGTSYRELENARSRGAQDGSTEGRRAGEADGYSAILESTQSETYQETIHRLYSSGDFHDSTSINIAVFYSFVLVGFGFQWLIFYIPRRFGYLLDIDWLVLPNAMTRIDLDEFSENQLSPRDTIPPSAGRSLIVLLMLLSAIGCSSAEKAWKEGYGENYRTAYQLGWQDGNPSRPGGE